MSKRKIILILLVIVFVAMGIIGLSRDVEAPEVFENKNTTKEVSVLDKEADSVFTEGQDTIAEADQKTFGVDLVVEDRKFNEVVYDGATVYDLLKKLHEEQKIVFVFKEFSGLGFFVESIDGVKYGGGKFWIFYINNKKAEVGISNYKLKGGDSIAWKLEDEI